MRVRTTCSGPAPASASASPMISRQRIACPYASSGSSLPSGITGAVPLTYTWRPSTTARAYPQMGSYGEPEEICRRTRLVSPAVDALMQVDDWPVDNVAAGVVEPDGIRAWHGDEGREYAWASVTKLVTALAVLVAAEEGVLDLDEAAGPPASTVRHLLAHASGLPFEGDEPIGRPGQRRIYSNTGFEQLAEFVAAR